MTYVYAKLKVSNNLNNAKFSAEPPDRNYEIC